MTVLDMSLKSLNKEIVEFVDQEIQEGETEAIKAKNISKTC